MSRPSPIADYLETLSRELAFDPALSRRVRHEVRDHLSEACLAISAEAVEAERRAVAGFGAAPEIAAQYRAAALYLRMRRTGALVLCAVAAIFAAMECRVLWYGFTQWGVGARLKGAGAILVPIDRYAFAVAIACGIVGWLYIASRPIRPRYRAEARDRLRRGRYLIGTAALAGGLAVACEIVLTGWRLAEAEWSARSLVPLASIAIEIAIAAAAGLYFRATLRRIAFCDVR
jgi:hypothetical protein